MSGSNARWVAVVLLGLLGAGAAPAQEDERLGFELTPPRLSLADGEVSFWRAGAEDWAPARVNTPLAAGDELYTAPDASLELQVGARAYLRAAEETQLGLTNLEPDYLQLRVTAGQVSLDVRSLAAGHTFELATPNAAFTVERTGYYRVSVDDETTAFTSRRGGRATLTLASGDALTVGASEQVVVSGGEAPRVESYAAPELDAWDRWNYARTDRQLDAVSARYVPSGVYGTAELDQHGDWRVVPDYGPLWVPRGVPVGWAPYSSGRWVYDPVYRWTWVDDAAWGWAPYHYGRWVHVSGVWCWAPGPLVLRPVYAPALVAFFGSGTVSVGVVAGPPALGWVALGWGEPLVPWWGPPRFHRVHWAGWGGPRVVNNVVVKRKTVVHVHEVRVYRNARVRDAVVVVDRDRFGRGHVGKARVRHASFEKAAPLHGELRVKPDRSSLVAERGAAKRPPRAVVEREVVARRAPRAAGVPELERRGGERARRDDLPRAEPPARVVPKERQGRRPAVSQRPAFARRGDAERRPSPPAPRFRETQRRKAVERAAPAERRPAGPRAERPAPRTEMQRERAERPRERAAPPRGELSRPRNLPGEPANRVYRARRNAPAKEARKAPRREEDERKRPGKPGRRGGTDEE